MARELNRELFGELNPNKSEPEANPTWRHQPSSFIKEEDWKMVLGKLSQMQQRMSEQDSRIDSALSRVNELANATKSRLERVAGATQRLEDFAKQGFNSAKENYAQLSGRLNERKVQDQKIQELVDRHNQMVQKFESRLIQMQRVINEQELQLLNNKAALKESQRELAILKTKQLKR